jgi:hypothetical protein
MDAQAIINAHARRMMVTPEQLSEALLFYGAGELLAWTEKQEESEPGGVWYAGDAPDWLNRFLPELAAWEAD